MSIATVIMISSRIKDSSDGLSSSTYSDEGVEWVSLAIIIMISSVLEDSSDGFVAVSVPVIEEITYKTLHSKKNRCFTKPPKNVLRFVKNLKNEFSDLRNL